MGFHIYYKTATFLLTLSAFLSLFLTGEIIPVFSAVMLAGLVGNILQERIDLTSLSRVLQAASLPILVIDYLYLSDDILLSFSHFLISVTAARIISVKKDSDYSQLIVLTFFMLLASAGLTTNISFAFTFSLYLVGVTWVLLLFHLKREVGEKLPMDEERALEKTMTIPFLAGTGGLALVSLIVTLIIFFILPRTGVGFFSKREGKVIKTSAFSDMVDFGSIGSIKLDPTVIMRVQMPDAENFPGTIYLRGTVLERFDGTRWEKAKDGKRPVFGVNNEFRLSPYALDKTFRQDIILDPIDSNVLFGMARVIGISGGFRNLFVDDNNSIYLSVNPSARFQYTVYSDIRRPTGTELAADKKDVPRRILEAYTENPLLSERVKGLALEIAKGADGIFEKVAAVEGYLKSNYRYSLNPARDESLPAVEDFLLKAKEGYCDHFATAMVLLLREAGVPSRLVTGYMAYEWNELGKFYTVRQSSAHSWVEVYFPSHGWISFDATPSSEAAPVAGTTGRLGKYIAYIKLNWDRYIINFSHQDQINAVKEARKRAGSGREAAARVVQSWREKITELKKLFIPAAFTVAVSIVLFMLFKTRGIKLAAPFRKKGKSVPFYEEMLRVLAMKGLYKASGTTAREFARIVIDAKGESYDMVAEMTDIFERVRYGSAEMSNEDSIRVAEMLRVLRKQG